MVEEIIKKLRAVKTMPDLEDMRRETLKAMKSGDHEVFLRVQKKSSLKPKIDCVEYR